MTFGIMAILLFGELNFHTEARMQYRAPVCEPTCPDGWMEYGQYCYLFVDQAKTYTDAEVYCSTLSSVRRSHLTSVANLAENTFLVNLAISSLGYTVWIGYDDTAVESEFVWKDGSSYEYVNWSNPPDNWEGYEHCVEVAIDAGLWNDVPCNKVNRFICKSQIFYYY